MENYEILSENLKIKWIKDLDFQNKKYTQVSGYIFNDKNELLIVKSGKSFTIPGGHPEMYETPIDTLTREIYEEAYVEINDIKYLGAVEVVENNEIYYQLRYIAKVKNILPFEEKWETSQRLFVNVDNLIDYIKWANGIAFKAQVDDAYKLINI